MSVVLAVTEDQALWWMTLGAGLVVAVVVWALLEALRRTVKQVERSVDDVWSMGKRLAQNTQTTHLLDTTKARGGDLFDEVEQHRGATGGSQR